MLVLYANEVILTGSSEVPFVEAFVAGHSCFDHGNIVFEK